uniref:Cytochrome P450 n=1 Tax=Timema poppense TaxID=170557 RepID=A0A7R9CSL8_TIMPO|nr:unnamed protein product [Timema poppensis]
MEVSRSHKKKQITHDAEATTSEARKPQTNDGSNLNSLGETKKKKPRTKAVLVQPVEGRTYADLLKEIKAKVNPTTTGVDIKSIKQTKNGGVLLEMGHKTGDSSVFTEAVKSATANIGTVKALIPTTTIEIRDIDGVTSVDDIREALLRDLKQTVEIRQMEDDDYAAQAHSFLLAGYHTTANTMGFALFELATHPNLQTRLQKEIISILNKHGGEVTHDSLGEMTYLDMVISETLRKYPILPFLDRRTLRDYKIPGTNIVLEKGTSVFIPLLGLHNDPKYFPSPNEFNPERFTLENRKSIPNYAYMPFGEGPRKCIGMRFGLMKVKTGLVHLLSKFEVRPCQQTMIPLVVDKSGMMMTTEDSMPLTFNRIKT